LVGLLIVRSDLLVGLLIVRSDLLVGLLIVHSNFLEAERCFPHAGSVVTKSTTTEVTAMITVTSSQ